MKVGDAEESRRLGGIADFYQLLMPKVLSLLRGTKRVY